MPLQLPIVDRMTPEAGTAAKRRPLLFLGNFLRGAAGNSGVSADLARNLAARGWSIITASHHVQRAKRLWHMMWTAWSRSRDYQVAHVDVFSGLAFLQAEILCGVLGWLGKPYVVTLHGGNLPGFARRWPKRARRLLRSAAAVTVPSRYLLEEMRPYREDLLVLPNALQVEAYRFRLRSKPRPRLVWLRAFHALYNPCLAPRVLALLAPRFDDVCLMMVGPDKRDGSIPAVAQVARALGVSDRIEMPGGVPKEAVAAWMDRGDIFLNTANVDNAPISVLEAMACGLCVVSTNVGGIPHLLEHEHDALLVPPNDPEAMAEAVRRLLTEPGLAEKLSRNGFRKAQGFDWALILTEWESLFSTVAEGRVP